MSTIRALQRDDWDDWTSLWAGYLAFYRAELPEATTRATFERLCAGEEGLFGLLAVDDAGHGIGMANCVAACRRPGPGSPSATWRTSSSPRRPGGSTSGAPCSRRSRRPAPSGGRASVYWHTQQYNGRARSLYDQVGRPTSFVVYEM